MPRLDNTHTDLSPESEVNEGELYLFIDLHIKLKESQPWNLTLPPVHRFSDLVSRQTVQPYRAWPSSFFQQFFQAFVSSCPKLSACDGKFP